MNESGICQSSDFCIVYFCFNNARSAIQHNYEKKNYVPLTLITIAFKFNRQFAKQFFQEKLDQLIANRNMLRNISQNEKPTKFFVL